ncbi:MAG: S-layer homology domain-containing protein [Oscillospiraceae bacterium]|nr:S-layer homology domain-containing protein [Oscillospiraceae bacterium]
MKLKRIISIAVTLLMTAAMIPAVHADELYSETFDMTKVKADKTDGVIKEVEVPDGDYTVTVTTGGKTETNANIYINGGERVRAYTLEAGETQENEQPVVPQDGKITVQVIGENPNVTEITIEQIPAREKAESPTIYIAGDSTAQTYDYTKAYPQTGWGQEIDKYFTDDITIENRAMAGRSSKSYNNDGRLDKILTEMHPGDYVFIQFGINDGAENKPERYISVEDYKTLITEKYIGEVEKRGGTPVLMTANPAAWWDEENNCFMESRRDYADPTREIAEETGCAFIDANRIVTDVWNSMDKDEVLSGYFICEPLESKAYPTGTNDTTHMKPKGANTVAGLIADAISDSVPELAQYLKGEESFTDISGHWGEEYINSLADMNMIDGVGNGKFNPDGTVTRAEFLKMAMDAAEIVGHAYREDECLDASNDDWYCYYLQGALDKDLIPETMIEDCSVESVTKTLAEATDTSDAVTADVNVYTGEFDGDTPITREEMTVIAMNALTYALKNASEPVAVVSALYENDGEFVDDDISEEYANSVDAAYQIGLVTGMGDGTFKPKETLTRAQAAVVISRLANLLK